MHLKMLLDSHILQVRLFLFETIFGQNFNSIDLATFSQFSKALLWYRPNPPVHFFHVVIKKLGILSTSIERWDSILANDYFNYHPSVIRAVANDRF